MHHYCTSGYELFCSVSGVPLCTNFHMLTLSRGCSDTGNMGTLAISYHKQSTDRASDR